MTKLQMIVKIKGKSVEEIIRDMERKFRVIAENMHRDALRLAAYDKGDFYNSINLRKINAFHYRLHDGVDYGIHIEFGTSPHIIRVRYKKALHWVQDGKDMFAKYVHHPGTTAQPCFRPALDMAKLRVINKFLK